MAQPTRPVFAIFEGGGAKGIAHVGALAAAEANGLVFYGVAGASAGAVVATLVSVGFAAKDILDPSNRDRNILAVNGHTPITVLGKKAWRAFARMHKGLHRSSRATVLAGGLLSFLVAPRTTWSVFRVTRKHGHFDTQSIKDFINTVLRKQLALIYAERWPPERVPDKITFGDLDYVKYPKLRPLKIVATDITDGALMVFDRATTPQVEVAEAVAASIAIPLVFRPVTVASYDPQRLFVDGGMVSNLPIWVFAEEKIAFERAAPGDPPIPIVAFTLNKKPGAPEKKGPKLTKFEEHLLKVGRTTIAGSQSLSQRFVEDLLIAPLETALDVLEFNASWDELVGAYEDGKTCADRHLRHALRIKPDRVQRELGRVHNAVLRALNARRKRLSQPPVKLLRANLAEPFGATSFRVTYGYKMSGDADDRLLLDHRGRGVPRAYKEKTLVFAPVGAAWKKQHLDYMTKYERALVRPGVRSLISAPVFESDMAWAVPPLRRPDPAGVLSFDSDVDLSSDFNDPQIRHLLATKSTVLFPALKAGASDGQA